MCVYCKFIVYFGLQVHCSLSVCIAIKFIVHLVCALQASSPFTLLHAYRDV